MKILNKFSEPGYMIKLKRKKYINHAKLGLINDGAVIANYYLSRG